MKRNQRLLLKTAKRIEEVPQSYDQYTWGAEDNKSPCGTVACLAGEIVICSERSLMDGIKKLHRAVYGTPKHVSELATELIGLSCLEGGRLFYSPVEWPNQIGKGFARKSQVNKARAAAELLRYLADGGRV